MHLLSFSLKLHLHLLIEDRSVDALPCIDFVVIMSAMARLVLHGYPALKLVAWGFGMACSNELFKFILVFHDLLQLCLMHDWSHSLLSPCCFQEFFYPSPILQIEGHAMLYVSFSVYYSSSLQLFGISPNLDDWIKLAVQNLGNATWILLIHCWCPGVNPSKVGW